MEAFVMKHRKKHDNRYASTDDWRSEFEIELADAGYARLSLIQAPWRKRWLEDQDNGRRSRDNEGWDNDRMNEVRRARKPYGRTHRDRNRFYDDEFE
jgi:hypothetical protein